MQNIHILDIIIVVIMSMKDILGYTSRKQEIGRRIRHERKRKNMSQPELAAAISQERVRFSEIDVVDTASQSAVSNWELGKSMPSIDNIACMSFIFECDMGYLLCDYDEQTHRLGIAVEETGLTYNAAKVLRSINKGLSYGGKYYGPVGVTKHGYTLETLSVLSELIESPRFLPLMNAISLYLIDGGASPSIAKEADDLSPQEYDRFMQWANYRGLGVEKKADICEMHLQTAADELKNMFCDVLEQEKKDKR